MGLRVSVLRTLYLGTWQFYFTFSLYDKFFRRANLNPIWLKDPSRNVSSAEIKQENEYLFLSNLLTGSTQSNCSLPCTTFKAETKLIQKETYGEMVHYNWVDFVPSGRIEVTQTKYMNSTLSQYMAEMVRNLILKY